jgi:peptidoglycan hydrolase-like protein with peptidoglycan-binding domain
MSPLIAVALALAGPAVAEAAPGGGAQVWNEAGCSGCHTLAAAGAGGQGGPNLDQLKPSYAAVVAQVTNGGGGMPPFGGTLSSAQIQALAAFVSSSTGGSVAATAQAPQPNGAAPAALPAAPTSLDSSMVRRLQRELTRLGFFHGPLTGFYGALTTAAVQHFQASVGLTADGVFGAKTSGALAKRLRALAAPARTLGSTPLPPPAAWVERLQVDLGHLGLFRGPDTGVYGPLTTAAVKRFQQEAGIAVDGRWGPQSQQALVAQLATRR